MNPTQQLIRDVKEGNRRPFCIFKEHCYFPVEPQPDSDELAQFPRLVLRHHNSEDTSLEWVEAGSIVYGWIIGIGKP